MIPFFEDIKSTIVPKIDAIQTAVNKRLGTQWQQYTPDGVALNYTGSGVLNAIYFTCNTGGSGPVDLTVEIDGQMWAGSYTADTTTNKYAVVVFPPIGQVLTGGVASSAISIFSFDTLKACLLCGAPSHAIYYRDAIKITKTNPNVTMSLMHTRVMQPSQLDATPDTAPADKMEHLNQTLEVD